MRGTKWDKLTNFQLIWTTRGESPSKITQVGKIANEGKIVELSAHAWSLMSMRGRSVLLKRRNGESGLVVVRGKKGRNIRHWYLLYSHKSKFTLHHASANCKSHTCTNRGNYRRIPWDSSKALRRPVPLVLRSPLHWVINKLLHLTKFSKLLLEKNRKPFRPGFLG